MTTKLPPRTTRYYAVNPEEDQGYMLLRRWIETYQFVIVDADKTSIEIGPDAARRLVANLTAALKLNGHWKEPKT